MNVDKFCDDGAFRESSKPRRVIRNVYDGESGQKKRFYVYFRDGAYWLRHGNFEFPLDPLNGRRSGSYSV